MTCGVGLCVVHTNCFVEALGGMGQQTSNSGYQDLWSICLFDDSIKIPGCYTNKNKRHFRVGIPSFWQTAASPQRCQHVLWLWSPPKPLWSWRETFLKVVLIPKRASMGVEWSFAGSWSREVNGEACLTSKVVLCQRPPQLWTFKML